MGDISMHFFAEEIIIALWGKDTHRTVVKNFKETISEIIAEENITRITDLIDGGLDMCLELLEKAKINPQTKLGANSITAFIYFRTFLDCVLAVDSELVYIHLMDWYGLFRITQTIKPGMHPYVEMIIKIYDLLDRGIEYLYKNMDSVSEDYFLPVEKRIRRLLNAYTDDDTGWNKIKQ